MSPLPVGGMNDDSKSVVGAARAAVGSDRTVQLKLKNNYYQQNIPAAHHSALLRARLTVGTQNQYAKSVKQFQDWL